MKETIKQEIEKANPLEIRNDKCSKEDLIWYQNYRREVLKLPIERKPFKKKFKKKLTNKKS